MNLKTLADAIADLIVAGVSLDTPVKQDGNGCTLETIGLSYDGNEVIVLGADTLHR